MKQIDCVVTLIQDVSKKSGTIYQCLELTFPNGYKKRVFLENAEQFIIEQFIKK